MSWSSKRRTLYFSSFIFLLIGTLTGFYYFFIYEAPNCKDGIQNQNEQGVDCGGVCPTICSFKTVDPVILWTRIFKISEGVYNVVALVENPNIKAEAFNIPYSFKIYDKDNILIGERRGRIDIPAKGHIPIFERTIFVGNRKPSRSPSFEFTKSFKWVKIKEKQPLLFVKEKTLFEKDGTTRLEVVIENKTVRTVKDIEVTGIISDKEGNALAVSQTIIESLSKNSSDKVIFTWPDSFSKDSSKIEIITLVK